MSLFVPRAGFPSPQRFPSLNLMLEHRANFLRKILTDVSDQHWAARGPSEIRSQIAGYVCESPFIAVHEDTQPSKSVVVGGRMAAKLLPTRQMVQKIDPRYLSRDPSVCKDFEDDELCHDTGTLEGLAGMLQRARELDSGRVFFDDPENCRLWVGHGTEDRVTSFKATARFMDRLKIKDKTFRVYNGHYHKRTSQTLLLSCPEIDPFSTCGARRGQRGFRPRRSRMDTCSLNFHRVCQWDFERRQE